MCLALYLFTDAKLPVSAWDESDPKLFVQAVTDGGDRDAKKWPHDQRHIYYIGGYQGCGCGWAAVDEWDDAEDRQAKIRDRLDLVGLLETLDQRRSWLVVCWEGEQGEPLSPRQSITLEQIATPEFEFVQLQPYRITNHG